MAKGIEIGIGTNYDATGVNEANTSLAKLVSEIGRANEELRNATMKAARGMVSFAEKADNAIRAMGGGYKDAEEFVREATRANEEAAQSVKKAASAYDDFGTILKRSAEAVDQRNRNLRQAEEVSKVLAKEQEKLSKITDKSSDEYKRAARNVEVLTYSLRSLGVQLKQTNNEVEKQPKTWLSSFSRIGSGAGGFFRLILGNLANIHHGFMMAASAVRTLAATMRRSMDFESMTIQFKNLTGSMDLARVHMKDLQDLGRTPPFSLEQFAAASRQMLKMTGGMAGFRKEMEMVGDMAAATGNSIEYVGRAFGLAYQVVRDGQSFGRAGQMLYTMGILTKQQVAYFDELSKSGKKNTEVWEELVQVFNRYKGAMDDTGKTTKGVVDAIKGEAEVALTDFSKAITTALTPSLNRLLTYLQQINEDGSIEDWADRSAEALKNFGKEAGGALLKIRNFFGLGDRNTQNPLMAEISAIGAGLAEGDKYGGGLKGFWRANLAYTALQSSSKTMSESAARALSASMREYGWTEPIDIRKVAEDDDQKDAEARERRREERRAKRVAERKAASDRAEAEAQERMAKDLERAQEEIDKRTAAKKAEEDKKAAEKAEAERLKAVEAERKAREKIEADLHRQRVENARKELKEATDKQNAMQTALSTAQTEFDKAFSMYRDRDLAARTVAEERDYAADYKQLKKDASRYGGSWRIDELATLMAAGDTKGQAAKLEEWRKSSRFTPEVEAMVRASAADQTRTTAEAELRKIAANTDGLSKKLDELLTMKGGM